jgi:hypothetical protein
MGISEIAQVVLVVKTSDSSPLLYPISINETVAEVIQRLKQKITGKTDGFKLYWNGSALDEAKRLADYPKFEDVAFEENSNHQVSNEDLIDMS